MLTTSFDGAGRPSGVSGSVGVTNTSYASAVTYAAHGGVAGLTGGDTLSRTIGYNARLQTASVSAGMLLTLGFTYSSTGTQDNGNVTQQTIARPGFSATQSYGYDGANRLLTASETAGSTNWSQSYVYDKAGNRAVTASSSIVVSNYTPQSSDGVTVPFDGNNHWISAAGYDGAGNMTAVRTQTMQYDAESRMYSWADSSNGASVALIYDGDGRRVTKTVGSVTTTYVYDPAGNLAAEYGGTATAGTLYLTQDHLGSTRLVTDASGNPVGCHDYLPFGEEVPASWGTHPTCYNQADTAVKFTGQERDPETAADGSGLTGFDNFLARMFASGQGRFLMPDPDNAGADVTNPQSWNMYSYAGNNPLGFIDPTGLCTVVNGVYVEDGGPACPSQPSSSTTVTDTAPPADGYVAPGQCVTIYIEGAASGSYCNTGGTAVPVTQGQPTVPPKFIVRSLPTNANVCVANAKTFYAPPTFDIRKIIAAGKAGGGSPQAANAAVGQYGTFDFQRARDRAGNTTFYSGYTPVSNFGVGAYLNGAGFSKALATFISNTYALFRSSNAGDPGQAIFRNLGYDTAASGQTPQCHPM